MPASDREPQVPSMTRAEAEEIFAITDAFCEAHLDHEYAALCRRLVAKLARKRPSPLEHGDPRIWAAGALYAVGANNFLFDPTQTPHLSGERLSELIGVPRSTVAAKAKRIRDVLGIKPMDIEFCRRELLQAHPVAWLVEVEGIVIDARRLPAEMQAEARKRGLIPDLALA
jgi:Domain of unknown function (DUF6398)